MNTSDVAYRILIQAYAHGRLSSLEFETVFLFTFKNDPGLRPCALWKA